MHLGKGGPHHSGSEGGSQEEAGGDEAGGADEGGIGLVVNFTQRIVQNWNLMQRFLVTNATIQLPEVITLSFTLKVYMMELFTSANIAHHILHTKERGH